MKKILCYLLLITLTHNFYAQDLYKNHQKYWYLRSKLRNDFMKIGTEQGESIPFTHRGKDANITDTLKNAIGGGDLISELGVYLGVLATEYRLLKNNYQNTDSVKHELYCALNAINRLDYNAEPMYGSNHSPNLNGFLVRDDIPKNFVLKNYKHFNYYNTWSGDTVNDVWSISNYLGDIMKVPNTNFSDRGFQSIIDIGQWQTNSVYYGAYQYPAEHG